MPEDFKVTPWEVTGEIDYDLLQQRFGTTPIDDALLERLARYGDLHYMLRRGIFYSHRDMIPLLDEYDKGNRFVLYTGRGPSGNTHLGHIMPWIFNKWVQDTFGVEMLFQLTDDEKFLFKDLTLEDTGKMAYENALDFIALGFDPKKTRIIVNTKNVDKLYPVALKVAKKVTFSTAKAVFGFENSTNIGSIFYTTMQSVPAFLPTDEAGKQVPVLIPCGQGHQGRRTRSRIPQALAHLLQDVPRTGRRGQDVVLRRERHDLHHRHPQGCQEEGRKSVHRRMRVGRGAEAEGRQPRGLLRVQVQLLPLRTRRRED